MNSSTTDASSSASASASGANASATIRGDTCAWVGGESCRTPRGCRACLNVAVPSGDECAIGPHGECMVSQLLQQQLQQSRSQSKIYPASNFSYCSVDDAACQQCTQQWVMDDAAGKFISSGASCTGANNCLCLAMCELPRWEANVRVNLLCSSTKPGNEYDNMGSNTNTTQLLLAGGMCLGLVATFTLLSPWLGRLVRKIDDSRQESLRNRFRLPVRVPSGPQLQLEGWTRMRERLMEADSRSAMGC